MPSSELTAEVAERYIDAVAPLLGLAVAPVCRPGVVLNLQIAMRLVRIAETLDLEDHDEPAAVFEA
ncbi:MAG: DUF4089 domain-containing protein [Phreatobacter sp.]|uniref:DUF4089 domain-containing protein n=1 Tax=Phreatobacter sp. TaxID=1966341 RepID=UPI0027353D73|nr:DUF4089 domain-containing protein [Phreatobacter sp.]MDP2802668.1 DUF4089 domain-containing protein [Phreatobacter sp.]